MIIIVKPMRCEHIGAAGIDTGKGNFLGFFMDKIGNFLERLKAEQRRLILNSVESSVLPSDNTLRKIADLESTIAAVEVMLQEEELVKKTKKP